MIYDPLSSAFTVTNARQAAAFAHAFRRRLVLRLVRRELSACELAAETRVELKRLHYHLGVLETLGLITVARLRPRAGRPIKLYRAVADEFFVPADLAAAAPGDGLVAELHDALDKAASQAGEGTHYATDSQGRMLARQVATRPGSPILTASSWRTLLLSPVEVRRLATEFDACLRAASERSQGAGKPYLVHFAFAPRLARGAPPRK